MKTFYAGPVSYESPNDGLYAIACTRKGHRGDTVAFAVDERRVVVGNIPEVEGVVFAMTQWQERERALVCKSYVELGHDLTPDEAHAALTRLADRWKAASDEVDAKAKAHGEAYQRKQAELEAQREALRLEGPAGVLQDMYNRHDVYYSFSDDNATWRAGQDQHNAMKAFAAEHGLELPVEKTA